MYGEVLIKLWICQKDFFLQFVKPHYSNAPAGKRIKNLEVMKIYGEPISLVHP